MYVNCKFHPVGQGIFSTGELRHENRQYRWVYDCGTASKQKYLTQQIQSMLLRLGPGRPTLDLAILSHFDLDHLSGFVELLTSTKVTTLLLPYIPLAYRLILAIESGAGADADIFHFLLDPVSFFSNPNRFQIETILLVPGRNTPPDDDEPPVPGGDRPKPDDKPGKRENQEQGHSDAENYPTLLVKYDVARDGELNHDERLEIQRHPTESMGPRLQFLRPRSALNVEDLWEFFPYNDIIPHKRVTDQFISDVEKQRDSLVNAPSDMALDAVKNLYDLHFGKTGKMRNAISLFIYAGFIGEHLKYFPDAVWVHYRGNGTTAYWITRDLPPANTGIIYTGDGFLKTGEQILRFANALGIARLAQKNFLQVMHHGSKSNSHPSVARFFSPLASIYCSDPDNNRYKHPHEEVKRQFSNYAPLQVDLVNGVEIQLRLIR